MTSHPVGLRELNKFDKLRRIKEAARELFVAKSFDDTTTREIAMRAGVGMGTIFLYADNKRDLLFLIANDELAAIPAKAGKGINPDGPVLTNWMHVFRLHYEFFGAQPSLSRFMLREMIFYGAGQQAQRFQTTRDLVIRQLRDIVAAGQRLGTIKPTENADLIAWVAFSIYQVELRNWLTSDNPDFEEGMDSLSRALVLLIAGAGVSPPA